MLFSELNPVFLHEKLMSLQFAVFSQWPQGSGEVKCPPVVFLGATGDGG